MRRLSRVCLASGFLLAAALSGCSDGSPGSFETAGSGGAPVRAPDGGDAGGGEGGGGRVVEEADIFRFVGDRLYVLNAYRGLYVFDVSDPDRPEELGRLPLAGVPVEMYVRGDRVYAILSDYFSYWRTEPAEGAILAPVYGSRIVGIDLADPTAPVELGSVLLDGYVSDTRLVGDILYAAANRWSWTSDPAVPVGEARDEIVITSIDVSQAARLREVDQLVLPGSGWFVQASADAFVVAGSRYDTDHVQTELVYVDISSPTGTLVKRGDVFVTGELREDTAIDLRPGQLRVLTRDWATQTTKLRIFDTALPDTLPLLGELDYAYDGALFGTTFDADRLYMVHYMRIDPLEVVDLSDPRAPRLAGILEMPGWIERIAPLGDRLIGLGVNDEGGSQRIAVSLFDVADPEEPRLLDRVTSGTDWSWSAASWERKAWLVDPASSLILFPYSGWNEAEGRTRHALGVLEFDASALTPRGEVIAPAPVERGAVREDRVYAISQAALQVIDVRDRDRLVATATVELARNVVAYARTSSVGVELVQAGLDWWAGSQGDSFLRLTPLDAPDGPSELGRLRLPRAAQSVLVHGDRAVALRTSDGCFVGWEDGARSGCDQTVRAGVTVVSLADPRAPEVVADLELPSGPAIPSDLASWAWAWSTWQSTYELPYGAWQGGKPALDLGGGRYGLIRTDTVSCSSRSTCFALGIKPFEDGVWDGDDAAYGQRTTSTLVVLDLSGPEPRLLAPIELGEGAAEHAFGQAGTLVYSLARPSRVDEEGRSYVRYFLERIRIEDDGSARRELAVNVPGVVVALSDDERHALTLDRRWAARDGWSGYGVELWLAAIDVEDDGATLTSSLWLGDELASLVARGNRIYAVALEYVAIDQVPVADVAWSPPAGRLITVSAADRANLRIASEQELTEGWWAIAALTPSTLVLSGGSWSGLALFDVAEDADHPAFRDFVSTLGWAVSITEAEDVIYVCGGPYGIQAVEVTEGPVIESAGP